MIKAFANKASRAKSIATGANAAKLTGPALTATAVGVAGTAAVKQPAAQEIKKNLGYGPDTSLIRAPVSSMAMKEASPPGQSYDGSDMINPTSVSIGAASAIGGGLGAAAIPTGGSSPKPTFDVSGRPTSPASFMKKSGKAAVNTGMSFFGSKSWMRTLGGVAGAAAGASLAGRFVDRLARKVVRTGTPEDRQLPDPTQPTASSTRTGTTSRGVASQARSGGGPTGSMVLDLHKTGGTGGVMT